MSIIVVCIYVGITVCFSIAEILETIIVNPNNSYINKISFKAAIKPYTITIYSQGAFNGTRGSYKVIVPTCSPTCTIFSEDTS